MSSPQPVPASNSAPVRKRVPWDKMAAVIAIALLLVGAFLEWNAGQSYGVTLDGLEQRFRTGKPMPLAELPQQIHGWTVRSEATQSDIRFVTLRWPSLFHSYKMHLPVFTGEMLAMVDTHDQIPTDALIDPLKPRPRPPLPVPVAATPPVTEQPPRQSVPAPRQRVLFGPKIANEALTRWLPKGYEQIVAIKLVQTPQSILMPGLLSRELFRQAILISAEEELGLTTLDPSIGEAIPTGEGMAGPLVVGFGALTFSNQGQNRAAIQPSKYIVEITLNRNTREKPSVWTAPQLDLPLKEWLEPLVEQAEALSRKEFVEGLLNVGYQKSTSKPAESSESDLPEDRMDYISQFARIRELHARRRAAGDTPELLGDLIRAYANLGNLIDYHWSPDSKAFKARSLLYAQRLVSLHGATPFTLAHQAYAQALTGRHAVALETINKAKQATGPAAPDWLDLIHAYCDWRPKQLDEVEEDNEELALYLRMRMTDMGDAETKTLQLIQRLERANPACLMAIETLSQMRGLQIRRIASEGIALQVWGVLYQRLAQMRDFPDAAASKISLTAATTMDEFLKSRLELTSELEKAVGIKDHPGPSWAALADLLKETSFSQLWRLINLEATALAVPTDGTLQQFAELVKGHRHAKLLDVYLSDPGKGQASIKEYMSTFEPNSIDSMALKLATKQTSNQLNSFKMMVALSVDEIAEDKIRAMSSVLMPGDNLLQISPKWPQSIAAVALRGANPPLAEWEETYGDSPSVLMAIYQRYVILKRSDDALRCMERLVTVAPTSQWYRTLGLIYKGRGEVDKWLDALELALEQPSFGLEHAQVQSDLAGYYAEQGKWDQAKPYALAAAESYSEWGLNAANNVLEGCEELDEAEAYAKAASERYVQGSANWYFWCVRTGHGDVVAAKALAERYWASTVFPGPNISHLRQPVAAKFIEGDLPAARELLRASQPRTNDMTSAGLAAVIADQEGKSQIRDAQFDAMQQRWQHGRGFVELTCLFRGVLTGKDELRWNPNVFNQLLLNTERNMVPYMYFQAGMFLANHGEPKYSEEYLHAAATSAASTSYATAMAAHVLRQKHIPVGKRRLHSIIDPLAPVLVLVESHRKATTAGKLDQAEADLSEAIKLQPELTPLRLLRGELYENQERYTEALADYEEACRFDPNNPYAHEALAWVLSTCEKAEFRDGQKALQHAERAASLRQIETGTTTAILAAAYAECGDFEKAVTLQTSARKLPGYIKEHEKMLTAYQAGKAYRQIHKPREAQPEPEPIEQ